MPAPRTVVIEGNDSEGYNARVPDLPGLHATGSTVDQAEYIARAQLREIGESTGIVRVEISG